MNRCGRVRDPGLDAHLSRTLDDGWAVPTWLPQVATPDRPGIREPRLGEPIPRRLSTVDEGL